MSELGFIDLYISAKPKLWRFRSAYFTLFCLRQLCKLSDTGYMPFDPHPGLGVRPRDVIAQIMFASQAEKDAYMQHPEYAYLMRRLERYCKRGGLGVLT